MEYGMNVLIDETVTKIKWKVSKNEHKVLFLFSLLTQTTNFTQLRFSFRDG